MIVKDPRPTISLVNPIIWVWEPLPRVVALVNGRGGGKGFGHGWDRAWERKREGEVERGFTIHGGLPGTWRSREVEVEEEFRGSFPPNLLQTIVSLISLSLSKPRSWVLSLFKPRSQVQNRLMKKNGLMKRNHLN